MVNSKQFSFVAVAIMLCSAFCAISLDSQSSDGERGEHVSDRNEFNNESVPVYSYQGTDYFGTILNPYTSADFDLDLLKSKSRFTVYVKENSFLKIHSSQQSYYHDVLLKSGWVYENECYTANLTHDMEYTVDISPTVTFYTVEKEGYITDNTHFYGFVSIESEPLLGINLTTTVRLIDFNQEFYVAEGAAFSVPTSDEVSYFEPQSGNSGLVKKDGHYYSDSLPVGRVHLFVGVENVEYYDLYMNVVSYEDKPLVYFDANGGSCDLISTRVDQGTPIILPNCVKDYSTFTGWFTDDNIRVGGAGDTYVVQSNVVLHAHYDTVPVQIVSELDDYYCVQGNSFSYTVITIPNDCVITVSGASWLTVSENRIAGMPSSDVEPGTYHIVITASYGNEYATQSFDLIVVKKLDFESIPTGGIIVHPVIL